MKDESKINVIHVSENKGPAIVMHVRITTTGWGQKTKEQTPERKGTRTQGDCKHRWVRLGKLFKFTALICQQERSEKAFVKIYCDGCLESKEQTLLGKA